MRWTTSKLMNNLMNYVFGRLRFSGMIPGTASVYVVYSTGI